MSPYDCPIDPLADIGCERLDLNQRFPAYETSEDDLTPLLRNKLCLWNLLLHHCVSKDPTLSMVPVADAASASINLMRIVGSLDQTGIFEQGLSRIARQCSGQTRTAFYAQSI